MHESITNPAFHYYFSALPQPALIDTRLKDRDRRLLAAFYLIAGRGNVIYNKTRKELGRLAGMAEDVVSRISTRLVKFGWLKKSGDGGRSQSAVYELIVPDQFTHLQRPISQKCSTNTTKQPSVPIVSQKISVTQKTTAIREKSPTTSPIPSTIVQEKGYSLSSSLEYPNGLDASFANSLLIQLPDTQQQVALDEWLGQVTSYKERHIPIHSPNGLFRSIIKSLLAGHTTQHATHVKQRRERATLIAKAIEQPSQKNQVTEQEKPAAKRFAPGELKAKLMEEVLKLKGTEQAQNPVISSNKTLFTESGFSKENPVHLLRAHINTQPTKNIKTTTTVANEAAQEKVDEVLENRGGGDLKRYPDKPLNYSLQTKEQLEGVGSLADDQTQPSTSLTKLTSAHEFVDEPSAQGVGRGQSLVGDSPPHPLSPTNFTRPDALRLPKQINIFSKPNKCDYGQEVLNDTQHGDVSSDTDAGTDQKMSAGSDGSQHQKGYRDLSHRQRTGSANQKGNRAIKQTLVSYFLKRAKELWR